MHRRSQPLALLALLAGCGIGSGGPSPQGLSYDSPIPNPATYTFTDTAVFTIDAALGPMEVITGQAGTAELDFRSWRNDGRVVVRFPRWRGTFRNPTQGASTADESDIGGPFTLHLSAAGRLEVVDTPSLSDAVLDIAGVEGLVRPLFVQLPASSVGRGARWVDTLTTIDESAGTRSVIRTRITSTLVGDTMVAGRRLLRIRTLAENSVEVTGISGGVEIVQRLEGTTSGRVLWDDQAHLLVERASSGTLSGTLELPGLDVDPMPVRARLRRTASLR
jgi:hypothetical protein